MCYLFYYLLFVKINNKLGSIQILRYSDIQIFRYSDIQILRYSDIKIIIVLWIMNNILNLIKECKIFRIRMNIKNLIIRIY